MIELREIERRAERLRVATRSVVNDYVLQHVLAGLAEREHELFFRGGTALARVYWEDFRLSEDLDFITKSGGSDARAALAGAIDTASQRSGVSFDVLGGQVREGRARLPLAWTDPWGDEGELLVDVVIGERPALPADPRDLLLSFSDMPEGSRIPTLDIAEILGTKWHMLQDRREPRDLFDLWYAFTRESIGFEEVARGYQAAYGYAPPKAAMRAAESLERDWERRIAPQMADAPHFARVLADVEKVFQAWG